MESIRERAEKYLELAEKATKGPWSAGTNGLNPIVRGITGDIWRSSDAKFIATSRTEGPWLAQKLLEAIRVIEFYAYRQTDGGHRARQFLEGGEVDERKRVD
ncbi:hypothetical protein [Alicyclobacillus macrosporangiidus]|uniref:Uncharacterized protein n=1 Tax=Alicyclobacillus macrosporangiidus TaxID=392015 RepID=A0A1I7KBI2_9BACL|nr:hypothetical protein [Alicyclobacillus macrosporangiidus]SFU94787.1 hypothetical protein SAMN05421543_1154 [Alicyclobacillus macrosporangiidus]